jgi:hypothetical protein
MPKGNGGSWTNWWAPSFEPRSTREHGWHCTIIIENRPIYIRVKSQKNRCAKNES